ncbi:MAG: hypothetical protein ACRCYO_10415 [Bacteroidia bacterium]
MSDLPNKKPESISEKAYEVPLEGSLGLLALGAKGLMQWRKKRAEWLAQNPPTPSTNAPKD